MSIDPSAVLTPPGDDIDPLPTIAEVILGAADWVSPSHWLLWAMEQVCGRNPAEWLVSELTGDWNAVMRASSALERLGEFHTQVGAALDEALNAARRGWDGAAAASAAGYFTELARAVEAQAAPFRDIARQYHGVAYGMWSTAQLLVGLLESLLDALLAAAASAAAAAATSWTIVGGLIGGGATAAALARAAGLMNDIAKAHGLAVSLAHGVAGPTAGFLASVQGFQAVPLPAGGYDHPVAR